MWFLVAEFAAYVTFVGVWGVASDATGRRTPFIVTSAVAGAVGYAALAAVPAVGSIPFEGVLLLRVFQGAMTIGAFSLTMTMLMDLEGGHGRNMGAAGIAIGLGAALGAPIGGQLTEVDPLAPLLVAAGLLVFVGIAVSLVEDRTPDERRSARALVDGIRRRPTLSIPFAFGFVDRLTAGFFALVGTLYFQEAFGLDAGTTGLMLACFFAPFALLQYPMGALSDRIGRTIPIVVGSLCYGGGILLVGASPSVATAAIAMVGVGVLGALSRPRDDGACHRPRRRERTRDRHGRIQSRRQPRLPRRLPPRRHRRQQLRLRHRLPCRRRSRDRDRRRHGATVLRLPLEATDRVRSGDRGDA